MAGAEPRLARLMRLTPRQFRVLRLRCEGKSQRQIAMVLSATPLAVNDDLIDIYVKLGLADLSADERLRDRAAFCSLLVQLSEDQLLSHVEKVADEVRYRATAAVLDDEMALIQVQAPGGSSEEIPSAFPDRKAGPGFAARERKAPRSVPAVFNHRLFVPAAAVTIVAIVLGVALVAGRSGAGENTNGSSPTQVSVASNPTESAPSPPPVVEPSATSATGGFASSTATVARSFATPTPIASRSPTRGPTTTPNPPANPTATLPTRPPRAQPAEVVRQFYALISAGNQAGAWELLSPRFQATEDYRNWLIGFKDTRSVSTPSVSTTRETNTSATVAVTVVAQNTTGTQTFQGNWDLVLVDGAWRLDVATIRSVR